MTDTKGALFLLLLAGNCFSGELYTARVKCCEGGITFPKLVARASKLLAERKDNLIVVQFSTQDYQGFGSSSDPGIESCLHSWKSMKKNFSHGFLFATRVGAGVYFWNHVTQTHSKKVLRGSDPLADRAGTQIFNIMWADEFRQNDSDVVIRAVRSGQQSVEIAKVTAGNVLREVAIEKATVYVRSDPWFWPDRCEPFSFPATWEHTVTNAPAISNTTFKCTIEQDGLKVACEKLIWGPM